MNEAELAQAKREADARLEEVGRGYWQAQDDLRAAAKTAAAWEGMWENDLADAARGLAVALANYRGICQRYEAARVARWNLDQVAEVGT